MTVKEYFLKMISEDDTLLSSAIAEIVTCGICPIGDCCYSAKPPRACSEVLFLEHLYDEVTK